MNDLISLVASKANISEENASTAVETLLEFIKEKAPAPLAGQIESLLSGEEVFPEGASGLMSKVSGFFQKG